MILVVLAFLVGTTVAELHRLPGGLSGADDHAARTVFAQLHPGATDVQVRRGADLGPCQYAEISATVAGDVVVEHLTLQPGPTPRLIRRSTDADYVDLDDGADRLREHCSPARSR
ncbi:hypothetical protein [Arsenicicoccus dermatophilus]|uniref:hypothetical protein n=1 Tax=Arsenicicoccus dermatophilus TaxID=1076331 RepID=UPI001F4CF0EC|nr:hypothetical protein [Arsenicicoccus dermatophilus]MCH8612465.1 hypothetical protein [Arsenicicoccus dermatophilus]